MEKHFESLWFAWTWTWPIDTCKYHNQHSDIKECLCLACLAGSWQCTSMPHTSKYGGSRANLKCLSSTTCHFIESALLHTHTHTHIHLNIIIRHYHEHMFLICYFGKTFCFSCIIIVRAKSIYVYEFPFLKTIQFTNTHTHTSIIDLNGSRTSIRWTRERMIVNTHWTLTMCQLTNCRL